MLKRDELNNVLKLMKRQFDEGIAKAGKTIKEVGESIFGVDPTKQNPLDDDEPGAYVIKSKKTGKYFVDLKGSKKVWTEGLVGACKWNNKREILEFCLKNRFDLDRYYDVVGVYIYIGDHGECAFVEAED